MLTDPGVGRARVITQSYLCFVYLRDRWFHSLRDAFGDDTAIGRCCAYLVSGRLRSFRNAFPHGNWCYTDNCEAIAFWDREMGSSSFQQFEVDQADLDFWQGLSRTVAYSSIQTFIDLAA